MAVQGDWMVTLHILEQTCGHDILLELVDINIDDQKKYYMMSDGQSFEHIFYVIA